MSRLVLKDLLKKHDDKMILNHINLAIENGEFIVIVGPSGCGKSTLLRLIAGLEEVTSGEIIFKDQLINNMMPKDRNMAMVFQNYALYPHMTVYNNLAYGLKRRGMKSKDILIRIEEAAHSLEITELLQRKPHQLSGGQRQRVAMGRAIVRRPDLYLFDEPLSNLDAKLRIQMRLEIKKLHKNFNITSLYVTHDQMEAMTLADRLVVLNRGVIEQIGAPLEVYRKPASIFVAGFIGSPAMNFIEGVVSANGNSVLITDNNELPLVKPIESSYVNRKIIVGIRPEHIYFANSEDKIRIPVTVNLSEALGAETILYGSINQSQAITILLSEFIEIAENTQLMMTIKSQDIHLFDSESKQRIN